MRRHLIKLRFWLLFAAIIIVSLFFLGWGSVGHSIINDFCVIHLPSELKIFVDNRSVIKAHASDADNRKDNDINLPFILKEYPRHYIDIDDPAVFPGFSTRSIPKDLSVIIAQVNGDSIKLLGGSGSGSVGVLPWAIVWTMDSLSVQMKRNNWSKVWLTAADLGHYVGDLHQPLHVCKDYNGRGSIPGSSGIHARYESTMLKSSYPYASSIVISPASAQYIEKPIDYLLDRAYESNGLIDSIYNADIAARLASGGAFDATYYAKLWEMVGQMTQAQFQSATQVWANLIYTIWINNGSPSTFVEQWTNQARYFMLDQNYPNPFNPTTTISFSVGTYGYTSIKIYDMLGQEVATLVNEVKSPGPYSIRWNADKFPSGIYIYRLTTGESSLSRKMILIK